MLPACSSLNNVPLPGMAFLPPVILRGLIPPENVQNIPLELRQRNQWVCWRYQQRNGRRTKIPVNPHNGHPADVTDPSTWGSFDQALYFKGKADGIGIVLADDGSLIGVDVDHCIDKLTGDFTETGRKAIERLPWTYAEISPSGTGLKFWFRRDPQSNFSITRNKHTGMKTEVYDRNRFFTVTGIPFCGIDLQIQTADQKFQNWYNDLFPPVDSTLPATMEERRCPVSADEVIATARFSRNSEKF